MEIQVECEVPVVEVVSQPEQPSYCDASTQYSLNDCLDVMKTIGTQTLKTQIKRKRTLLPTYSGIFS